jgi:hypothetical protein
MGIPMKFMNWIKECIAKPSYIVSINGSLVAFFKGKKSLWQGDPLPPYLFVIEM